MNEQIESLIFLDSFRVNNDDTFAENQIAEALKPYADEKCLILCIGTDKYIGDCLGPLVGTYLLNNHITCPVFGTLDMPVHAINLKIVISEIKAKYPNHTIIVIDACLGAEDCIGTIQIRIGAIHPGKGVGKKLPPVGDISIVGIVDSTEHSSIFPLYNIRLGMIIQMASVIAKGICIALPAKSSP